MDLASSPVFLDDGRLKGSALVVFLTKGKVPMTYADIKGNHGQRDWDSKFPELEKTIAPEQVEGVVRKLQHGYRGGAAAHAAVVKLFESMQLPVDNLVTYYEHCRSMQRDLCMLAEEDVDYQDLFCDKRRAKIFSEEFGFPCTFAAVADMLRLHPALMGASWNATSAPRDADKLWWDAAGDVERFAEMLRTDSSLTDDERMRLMPRALVQDKRLYVNYTANFLLIGHCRGPLARNLRIKGAALKALAEVGVSSAVRSVLSRALREDASGLRSQLDPLVPASAASAAALIEVVASVNAEDLPRKRKLSASAPSASRAALIEPCISWESLNVPKAEVKAVQKQFEMILRAAKIPAATSQIKEWQRKPPVRFQELAALAVRTHRSILSQVADSTSSSTPGLPTANATQSAERPHAANVQLMDETQPAEHLLENASRDSEAEEEDPDLLTIGQIMRTAGVWKPVKDAYRNDLSFCMHSLKCDATRGCFSKRRPHEVRGQAVLVHSYQKSIDSYIAREALRATKYTYERRVRDFLVETFILGRAPNEGLAQGLARAIADRLDTDARF